MNWNQRFSYAKAALGVMHGSRAFGGPVNADLYLTNRCNISCIHCYYYSPHIEYPNMRDVRKSRLFSLEMPASKEARGLQKIDADTERTNALIDELTGMGTRRFRFTGAGEALLHRNALEFFGRVKRTGAYCAVSTAGHLFTKAKIDELVRIGVDELRISTLAGEREAYQRTHPGSKEAAFDAIRDNLLYLAERKAALKLKWPSVNLCLVVISHNYDGLMDFAEFAAEVGADKVAYRPFDDVEDPGLSVLKTTVEEALHAREQLVEARPYLESRGIQHNIDFFLKATGKKLDTKELYRAIPCYMGWVSTQVLASGLVYPCGRCYDCFGNINEQTFEEIWSGEAYRRFRQEAISINKRKTPVTSTACHGCTHFHANIRVDKYLRPVRSRSARVDGLRPAALDGPEDLAEPVPAARPL